MTAQPIDGPRGFVRREALYAALAEIDNLKDEIAYLRSELIVVRGLEKWHRIYLAVPGLTPGQAGMVAALHATKAVVPDPALYEGSKTVDHRRRASNDWCEVVKVHICKARRAIVRAGGPADAIATHWGMGYRMTDKGRKWLDKWLEGVEVPAQPPAPEPAPTASQSPANGISKQGGRS